MTITAIEDPDWEEPERVPPSSEGIQDAIKTVESHIDSLTHPHTSPNWMPRHDRLSQIHEPDNPKCDCTGCLMGRVAESIGVSRARRAVKAILHDLDPNCGCDDCAAVREIKDKYA